MLVWRVGARFLAGGHSVVNMPPVVGRDRCGIDAETLDRVDRLQHALDLSPAFELEQDVAAGTNEGHGLVRFARTMSMREMIVPYSPAAQRTKAKMLFGAKPTILRRRSRICS